jgi:hypothetical protein
MGRRAASARGVSEVPDPRRRVDALPRVRVLSQVLRGQAGREGRVRLKDVIGAVYCQDADYNAAWELLDAALVLAEIAKTMDDHDLSSDELSRLGAAIGDYKKAKQAAKIIE